MTVKHSSLSNEQYTPVDVVERVRQVLKIIDLDPATSKLANKRVRARQIFTLEDGPQATFEALWRGTVFVNPPGGQKMVLKGTGLGSNPTLFWAKLMHDWAVERTVKAAIFLGFTLEVLQSSQRVEQYPMLEFPFCVPSKRLAFDVPREDKMRQLEDRIRAEPAGNNVGALKEKLIALEKSTAELVPGDDPPHANVVVLVPPHEEHFSGVDTEDRRWVGWKGPYTHRFFDVFSELGYVRR